MSLNMKITRNVGGELNTTNITTPSATNYNSGTTITITAPATAIISGSTYNFSNWEDGTIALIRTVTLKSNLTITATYKPKTFTLAINSSPEGIVFTIQ